MMMATKEAVTSVYWDIRRCPVPSADVASRVGPVLKGALKNLGYSGPLTITAVGILTRVPIDILRAVYSSGVSLAHVDTEFFGIDVELECWGTRNPLGNLFLISTEDSFNLVLDRLDGDNMIPYLPLQDPSTQVLSDIWESFLASLPMDPALLDADPGWYCQSCLLSRQGFENFHAHLNKEYNISARNRESARKRGREQDDDEEEEEYIPPLYDCQAAGFISDDEYDCFISDDEEATREKVQEKEDVNKTTKKKSTCLPPSLLLP